jgi:hypothetical protein
MRAARIAASGNPTVGRAEGFDQSGPEQGCGPAPLGTAVMTPKEAPAVSRFISAARAGISKLQKTAVSNRNESSTTTPRNSGSAQACRAPDVAVSQGQECSREPSAPGRNPRAAPGLAPGARIRPLRHTDQWRNEGYRIPAMCRNGPGRSRTRDLATSDESTLAHTTTPTRGLGSPHERARRGVGSGCGGASTCRGLRTRRTSHRRT